MTVRRRRWFRFRVATLLLLVTAISVLGAMVNRAHQQREVVGWIGGLGGDVRYDFQTHPPSRPSGPKWLRGIFGGTYWDRITGVYLQDTSVEEDELRYLAGLSYLTTLNLNYTNVSDAGLKHISQLPRLEKLYLRGTFIQGEGLANLESLPNLRRLDLGLTEVSDVLLQRLKHCPSLEYVAVDDADVTAAGVLGLNHALPRLRIHRKAEDFANWLKSCRHLGDLSGVSFRTNADLEAAIGKPDEMTGDSEQVWTYRTAHRSGSLSVAHVRVTRSKSDNRLRLETPHFGSLTSLRKSIGGAGTVYGTNLETWRFDIGSEQVHVKVYHDKRTLGLFLLVPDSVVLNPHLAK